MTLKYETGSKLLISKTTKALKAELLEIAKGEDYFQQQVVELLNKLKFNGVEFWHTPNGGKRGIKTAMKLKAMGTRRGVPDLIISLPSGSMAFLELKSSNAKRKAESLLTPEQRDFLALMRSRGHWAHCSNNFDDVCVWLARIGAIKVSKAMQVAA
jgi:VRR-NUC domain